MELATPPTKTEKELRLARSAYNWLRVSPLLTIPTLIFVINLDLGGMICDVPGLDCDYTVRGLISNISGVILSALWHLLLLQYVNDKDSEFVRENGQKALTHAGIRTGVALLGAVLTSFIFGGSISCIIFVVLAILWITNNSKVRTLDEEIKKILSDTAPPKPDMIVPQVQLERVVSANKETLSKLLEDLQNNDDVTVILAIERLEAIEDIQETTLKQAILKELELLADEDDNKDIRMNARVTFNRLTQTSLVLDADAKSNAQTTLTQLLQDLQSEDESRILSALETLKTLSYSSEAVRLQLEKISLRGVSRKVRSEARALLNSSANRAVTQRFNQNRLDRKTRDLMLGEIKAWAQNELIEKETADVLSRRYDFDIAPPPAQPKPFDAAQGKPAPAQPAATPQATPAPIAPAPSIPQPPPAPPVPRPSLLQTLTSEASIKIYLYLGAFFVIAAAAILGAVVPEFRLPILILGTFLFGGLAVAIKKRLPQPSFALFIVFSFLLPITANSLEETMRQSFDLSSLFTSGYWAVVFFFMAVIWSGGTRLYASRLFSITAFGSLLLAFFSIGRLFNAEPEIYVLLESIAVFAGLAGVWLLRKWMDRNFSLPLFMTAQILQFALLFISLSLFGANLFDPSYINIWHLAAFATWILAAVFFILSNYLYPFFAYPWLVAATLIPMPWIISASFDLESLGSAIVLFGWGSILAVGNEALQRIERTRKYSLPVLLASMPSLALAVFTGFVHEFWLGSLTALGVATIFTALHIFRTRWWLWTLAHLSFILAYFAFFQINFIQKLDVFIGYQILGISLLFLLPDLLLKKDWRANPEWRLSPRILGAIFTACNLFFLLGAFNSVGSSVSYAVYTIFFTVYALAYKKPLLVYIPAATLPLAIVFGLDAYKVDAWLPILTTLAVIYFIAGLALRTREGWTLTLRNSALILASVVSIAALILMKETGGWYALVAGALFAAEMYIRKDGRFELGAPILFTLGAYLILRDFNNFTTIYHLLTYSLVWIFADLLTHLTFQHPRPLSFVVRGIGALLTGINTILILTDATVLNAAICFGIYTLAFTIYALAYRTPWLGYIPATSLPLTIIYTFSHLNVDAWLPALTTLAILYFMIGMAIRVREGWSFMLRNSALILGSLLSLGALITLKETGGWYALVIGLLFIAEMYLRKNGWFEPGAPALFTLGIFLILRDFNIERIPYHLLAYSLVWLLADLLAHLAYPNPRPLKMAIRFIGGSIALVNYGFLFLETDAFVGTIGFGVYALLFLTVSLVYRQPNLLYTFTVTLPLFVVFLFRTFGVTQWIHPVIVIAMLYYAAGTALRAMKRNHGWEQPLLYSGLGLGVIVSIAAPILGGVDASIPVAIAATLWAVEAYARKNAWLAFPANGLYLLAYFIILFEFNVDEPQFFSVGTALFGLIQHYLLTRANSRSGAFIMGMFSQFVLLGTTYIEMVNKNDLNYFFLLFLQSLVVLVYGIVIRSRSLTLFPIGFVALGVITVVYSALKDIGTIFVIGCTGIVLLMLGVGAVLLRERITKLGETLSEWKA